jgi:hypothetical protein
MPTPPAATGPRSNAHNAAAPPCPRTPAGPARLPPRPREPTARRGSMLPCQHPFTLVTPTAEGKRGGEKRRFKRVNERSSTRTGQRIPTPACPVVGQEAGHGRKSLEEPAIGGRLGVFILCSALPSNQSFPSAHRGLFQGFPAMTRLRKALVRPARPQARNRGRREDSRNSPLNRLFSSSSARGDQARKEENGRPAKRRAATRLLDGLFRR